MKKFSILLIALIVVSLSACSKKPKQVPNFESEIIPGDRNVQLNVEKADINTYEGYNIELPTPNAIDSDGGNITEEVYLEIKTAQGEIYTPKTNYQYTKMFRPAKAGTYYAFYTVEENEKVLAKEIVKINASKVKHVEGMIVDGVLNDEKYALIPSYQTGVNGNMDVKLYFADNGLYLGVNVKDSNIIYNDYVVGIFTQSDGFELYLNLSDEEGDLLNPSCYKLEVNARGDVWFSKARQSKVGFELLERIRPEHSIQYHGTRTAVDSENVKTYRDLDTGYTFETFIPFGLLDITSIPNVVGIATAHRDISSMNSNEIGVNDPFNQYYIDLAIPKSMKQIIKDNGRNYLIDMYESASITALYNKLYIKGDNLGVATPQVELSSVVDGLDNDDIYNNSTTITTNDVEAKTYLDDSGLYVYAKVTSNRKFVLNIASNDILNKTELPTGYDINSKTFRIDGLGNKEIGYLNTDIGRFIGGYDHTYKIVKTLDGYAVEIFIPRYEIGQGQIGICLGLAGAIFSSNNQNPSTYTKLPGGNV